MPDLADADLLQFLDLAFDAVCARTVADLVDPERLLDAVDLALAPARVAHWQARLLAPQRERLLARAATSSVKLGAWLPADVTTALADLLGAPARLPRKAIDQFVGSDHVRETVRTMLQDSLSSLVGRLTTSGSGGAGLGIRDALGWGARAAAAAGKGLLGGIGGEIQKQLQDRVRDVVDGSMAMVQARIADRLASDETARTLGAARRRAFLGLLEMTEADAAKSVRRTPFDKLDSLVPKVIAHNLARAEVREVVRDEIRAVVAELARQTVGELLDEAGLRDAARAALHAHGLPIARALAQTPGFQAFWAKVATPAAT